MKSKAQPSQLMSAISKSAGFGALKTDNSVVLKFDKPPTKTFLADFCEVKVDDGFVCLTFAHKDDYGVEIESAVRVVMSPFSAKALFDSIKAMQGNTLDEIYAKSAEYQISGSIPLIQGWKLTKKPTNYIRFLATLAHVGVDPYVATMDFYKYDPTDAHADKQKARNPQTSTEVNTNLTPIVRIEMKTALLVVIVCDLDAVCKNIKTPEQIKR